MVSLWHPLAVDAAQLPLPLLPLATAHMSCRCPAAPATAAVHTAADHAVTGPTDTVAAHTAAAPTTAAAHYYNLTFITHGIAIDLFSPCS